MAWATEDEVLAVTGVTVTGEQLTAAHGLIDLFSGIGPATEGLAARDLRLLRQAVAYQTVWMAAQVDPLTRTSVTSLEQDGVKVAPGEPADLLLAPLAKLALQQLSWNRRTGTRVVCPGGPQTFRTLEE